MDRRDDYAIIIATIICAMISRFEAVLERKRQKKRRMEQSLRARQAALQEKRRERAMLMKKKQKMLAEQAAKEKLVDNFMVNIEAIENDDPEVSQNFDEKAMMDTILSMITSDCGDVGVNGGFTGGDNVPKIKLELEENATMDASIAMITSDGNCGANNGGFSNDNGGINGAPPENAQNLGDEVKEATNKGTKSDGGEGGAAGCNGKLDCAGGSRQ